MSSHATDFKGSVLDAIRAAIEVAIPGARVDVQGGDGHYSIEVTSPVFAGKKTLESHRLVMSAIAHLMQGAAPPIHAVDALKTVVPATTP